jgi:hypothetical protein
LRDAQSSKGGRQQAGTSQPFTQDVSQQDQEIMEEQLADILVSMFQAERAALQSNGEVAA